MKSVSIFFKEVRIEKDKIVTRSMRYLYKKKGNEKEEEEKTKFQMKKQTVSLARTPGCSPNCKLAKSFRFFFFKSFFDCTVTSSEIFCII